MLNGHALYASARNLARQIGPIEVMLDEMLVKKATLLASASQARLDARLSITTGQPAIKHVVAAINATMQAQTEMIAAHREFAGVRDELRIPETGTGSADGCPGWESTGVLRAVEQAA